MFTARTYISSGVLVVMCVVLPCCARKEAALASPAVVDVVVARAKLATIPLAIESPAIVFPAVERKITSRIVAPIREVRVKKGDRVVAGELLAVLDDRDLLAAREEAHAAVEDARTTLHQSRSAASALEGDRARVQSAPPFGVRDLTSNSAPAPGVRESRPEDPKSDAAEQRLKTAQARLDDITGQIEDANIHSPITGIITDVLQYEGDMASSSAPILTVMDLSTVNARTQIPGGSAHIFASGRRCEFHPDTPNSTPIGGRLNVPRASRAASSASLEASCVIPNRAAQLRVGATGTVTIETGGSGKAAVVPASAIQSQPNAPRKFVFVVDSARIAHKQNVEARAISPTEVAIIKGIHAGQLIVSSGGSGLADGVSVRF